MEQPTFSAFPNLTTARFILRKLSLDDAPAIYQLRADIEVARLTGRPPCTSIDEAITYIKKITNLIENKECIFWAIAPPDSSALIGVICFWNFDIPNETMEIGYELLPEFHSKGIMAEAISGVLNYGMNTLGVKTIVAFPSSENPASVKLLEKMGFKLAPHTYSHSHSAVPGQLTYIIT